MRDGLDELKARQEAARRARAAAEQDTDDSAHLAKNANRSMPFVRRRRLPRQPRLPSHRPRRRRPPRNGAREASHGLEQPSPHNDRKPPPRTNPPNHTPFTRWNAIPAPKRRQGRSTVSADINQCGQCGLFIRDDDHHQHAQWHQENEQ